MSVVFAMIRTRHSDLERIIEECGAQDIASQLHMAPSFWEYVKHVNEEWEREKSMCPAGQHTDISDRVVRELSRLGLESRAVCRRDVPSVRKRCTAAEWTSLCSLFHFQLSWYHGIVRAARVHRG